MTWAIVTNYTSDCPQMDPQRLHKTSKFYSRSKKCNIEKTLGGGYHPLGSPKVNLRFLLSPYFYHDVFMHHALHALDPHVNNIITTSITNTYYPVIFLRGWPAELSLLCRPLQLLHLSA